MDALEPTGTVTMTPADLSRLPSHGDGVVILSALGIATEHRLTLDMLADGRSRLIYSLFPEGGPSSAIQAWGQKPREFKTWELLPHVGGLTKAERAVRDAASMRIQAGACQYVLDAACDEVAAEYCLADTDWRAGA